ncbi:MAG: DUF2520 domain-containing protein [Bacteroidales bacterium]|nr:DUF2520 domain-containing protein [Bacteroidales bacterium]
METPADINKIVILGAGSVATHLAIALDKKGYNISQIYSRTSGSAEILSAKINAEFITDLKQLDTDADLYIIALKDSVVECLIRKLFVNGIVVHTSGTLPMAVLKNMSLSYGVFYPLQTFSKSRPISFDHIPVCIEASDERTLQSIRQVAQNLTNKIYEIDSEQRQYLHLSAVFSCNFSNFMYVAAADILKSRNIDFEILIPLIREFLDKLSMMNPWDAQTGPAIRDDSSIITRQLELLDKFPDYKEIYRQITEKIIDRKNKENNP